MKEHQLLHLLRPAITTSAKNFTKCFADPEDAPDVYDQIAETSNHLNTKLHQLDQELSKHNLALLNKVSINKMQPGQEFIIPANTELRLRMHTDANIKVKTLTDCIGAYTKKIGKLYCLKGLIVCHDTTSGIAYECIGSTLVYPTGVNVGISNNIFHSDFPYIREES